MQSACDFLLVLSSSDLSQICTYAEVYTYTCIDLKTVSRRAEQEAQARAFRVPISLSSNFLSLPQPSIIG